MKFDKKEPIANKGQAILEYIIITSLIGIICLSIIKQFGTTLKTRMNHINSTLVEKLKI
jgi:Flp pilus assembly pilin Flp